ncbi:hypothetical protein GB931_05520 [Modestobacter sp. I12A-02628]|uniref:Uncharacterized protein n=1 Tax=Goekera deserti TaxID=2497753 RepID=A0A7K3WBA9_9ACTN|nr:hypothetical protein [Goekera deserti]MPQ97392.1 hypothetical protein [Goekera deserti]NDI48007.1 hypothetical protein [Goekera deserti]NEL53755.1 hypothetical protein [Goekera deserti]
MTSTTSDQAARTGGLTPTRLLLLNSAVAFALACLVMVTLHELAHALAGVLQGGSPVLYGFSVDQGPVTDPDEVRNALAGPLFSLVSGLLVLALPTSRLPGVWRLAVTWFGLVSVQEFSGYLITGPFAHIGDIGTALELSGSPAWLGWLGFAVGWGLTYLLGRTAVRRLAAFLPDGAPMGTQLRAVGLFAWLLGAAVTVLLSLGLMSAGDVDVGTVAFEALGLLTAGIFLVFVRLFLPVAAAAQRRPVTLAVPVAALVVLVVLAVARQVVLAGGITF